MSTETEPVQIQIQTNQIFDEEQHCCGYSRRSPHLTGLIFCILVWSLLITTIYFYLATDSNIGQTLGAVFLSIMYLFYLLEAFLSKTSQYLWNMKRPGEEDIIMYVERLKKTPPIISMGCQCYHYETRTRYVTETYTEYVNGQSVTRTRTRVETYQEKVVTYTGYEMFQYSEWSDNSGFLSDEILKYNVVRIDMRKSWVAGNSETTAAFERQYDEFKRKHENRDTYFASWTSIDINGYESNVSSVIEPQCYLNWQTYAVITICYLGSVFYRYWFDWYSVKGNFEFKKIVKL